MELKSEAAKPVKSFHMPALWEKDKIKTQQDSIRGSLVALDVLIHENAVQCLMHAEKHGDTSLMRRLLVDIVDAKTGYRRQGIIAWMRAYSPMELKGDTINLSGMNGDKKRPFQLEMAAKTPFYLSKRFDELEIKPFYQQTLLSKMNAAIKAFKDAKSNTNADGTPIDAKKPFLDMAHAKEINEFMDDVEGKIVSISALADNRKQVRDAKTTLAAAQANATAVGVSEMPNELKINQA